MTRNRYQHLLSPGRIGSLALRNRIVVTAMGVSLSEDDGTVGERLLAYHEEQARGGAGLIVSGVAGVAWPVGAVSPNQTAISDDRFLPGLTRLCERVHRHGARIAAQLHHGGLVAAYSHARWGHPLWAPSVPDPPKGDFTDYFLAEELEPLAGMTPPDIHILAQGDIDRAVAAFASGARRAKLAGFDGIEIHAGHGYLLSSFLSPATNRRTDLYGGELANRARLALDTLRAVRAEVGDAFPLWMKIDTREIGKAGGITLDLAQQFAEMVEAAGADAITATTYHETGNGKLHSASHTPHDEAANLAATAAIRNAVTIPVIGSGRIDAEVADAAIGKGALDFVAMGRKLLADPHLPAKLGQGRPDRVRPCVYCYTCISAIYMGEPVRCAVNAELGREGDAGQALAPLPARIAVIGGGPGGMEAARRLAASGHAVTLIERGKRLGGTLRFASLAYAPNERLLDWMQGELRDRGVDIRLSTEATPEMLREIGTDQVVVATGGKRAMPALPGSELPHVFSGDDLRAMMLGEKSAALGRKTGPVTRMLTWLGARSGLTARPGFVRKATHHWMPLGRVVVIIGGELVGLELAEFLQQRGRRVAVIEEAPRLGKGLPLVRRMRLLSELSEHGVRLEGGASEFAVDAAGVAFNDASGARQRIEADTVIVAKGAEGDLASASALSAAGFAVHPIGDALAITYIEGAVRGAAEAARRISAAHTAARS